MEAESEGDIPAWAFSPAKYFTPSDAEVEPKALDEVMSNNVIWLRIGIIYMNLLFFRRIVSQGEDVEDGVSSIES